MEGPLAPGAANGTIHASSPTTPVIEPQILVDYLEKVLDVNLGATDQDLRAPGSLLSPSRIHDTLQRCNRFALENQTAIYLVKDRTDEARLDGLDVTNGKAAAQKETSSSLTLHAGVSVHYTYTLTSEFTVSPTCAAYIVITKRPIPIDPSIPISAQVQITTLPGFTVANNNASTQDGGNLLCILPLCINTSVMHAFHCSR